MRALRLAPRCLAQIQHKLPLVLDFGPDGGNSFGQSRKELKGSSGPGLRIQDLLMESSRFLLGLAVILS
jgi:hypothetical protein